MRHLFRFAARFSRLLEIGAALHKKKPGVTHVRLKTVRAGWVATGAAGFSALVALSLFAVSLGTAGIDDDVASAHTPACPSSIPTADGEFFWTDSNDDHWFIIRQTTNAGHMLSGHTLIRAYVASSSYDAGYVSSTPHDTCFLKVRGPDDDEDLDPPVQILVWHDQDDSSDENTEGTQQPSAALWLLQAPGNSETAGLVTLGLTTFVYEGTVVTIVIILSNLELRLRLRNCGLPIPGPGDAGADNQPVVPGFRDELDPGVDHQHRFVDSNGNDPRHLSGGNLHRRSGIGGRRRLHHFRPHL